MVGLPVVLIAALIVLLFLNKNNETNPAENTDDTNTSSESSDDTDTENSTQIDDNDLIVGIIKTLEATCQDPVNLARYESSYRICTKDELSFRIDELKDRTRLIKAMQADCSSRSGVGLSSIGVIQNEQILISSYLLSGTDNYPAINALYKQLRAEDYQMEIVNICESFIAPGGPESVEDVLPVQASKLADLKTASETAGAKGCRRIIITFKLLGVASLTCNNETPESTDDIQLIDTSAAAQFMNDKRTDSLEFTACDASIKGKMIDLGDGLYIISSTSNAPQIAALHEKLIQQTGYAEAKLLDVCNLL